MNMDQGNISMHEKRFAGSVERLRSPERVAHLEVERVVDLFLEDRKIGRLLDVGTGSGLFAEAFARRGLDVAGVDARPEMLEAAREFVPAGQFKQGVVEALPYKDKSFEMVFLSLVLHESDDPLEALKEAFRVAKQWVGVLEWPYRQGMIGPPLHDQISPEDMVIMFREAGFRKWKSYELDNTVLYILEV
jgi:ubiquinone/menaquinone biosynthesis C-methylase UbiE